MKLDDFAREGDSRSPTRLKPISASLPSFIEPMKASFDIVQTRQLSMYDIETMVKIVEPVEVILGGNCPLTWLHAPGIRSAEIVRKLPPDENVSAVREPAEWSEIPQIEGAGRICRWGIA